MGKSPTFFISLLEKSCIFFVIQNKSCDFFSDPPGSVTITPNNDTFYTKIHGKPLHDITCEADCLPKCTYMWFRHDNNHPYTTGNSLFAKESYDFLQPSKTFLCRASNKHKYRDSTWITIKAKSMKNYLFTEWLKFLLLQ